MVNNAIGLRHTVHPVPSFMGPPRGPTCSPRNKAHIQGTSFDLSFAANTFFRAVIGGVPRRRGQHDISAVLDLLDVELAPVPLFQSRPWTEPPVEDRGGGPKVLGNGWPGTLDRKIPDQGSSHFWCN